MSWGYNDFLYLHNEWTIEEILDLLEQVEDLGGMDRFNKQVAEIGQKNTEIKELSDKVEELENKNESIIKKIQKYEYIIMNLLFKLAGTHEYRTPAKLEISPNQNIILRRDIVNGIQTVTIFILHKELEYDWTKPIVFYDNTGKITPEALDIISRVVTIKQNGEKYEVKGYVHIKDLV